MEIEYSYIFLLVKLMEYNWQSHILISSHAKWSFRVTLSIMELETSE